MQTTGDLTMGQLLVQYPWAKRALFQKFHIGGCASCGFGDEETLAEVCARNGGVTPDDVLEAVRLAHEQDEAMMIDPLTLKEQSSNFSVVDIRTKEEFEAVHIPRSFHFSQTLMSEIMSSWPKDRPIVIIDHRGERGLDAASYLAGHGFCSVRCLRGGIDAYSELADASLPRYSLEPAHA
ncbi:MAG: rhodanese-like domain-containing protein [Terrimicrobiaceae bacterium]